MKKAIVILILLLNFSAFAYHLGIKNLTANDNGTKIDATLWYPTDETPQNDIYGIHEFYAAYDAKPADNIKGIVIFSHGFGSTMYGNFDTGLTLALNGYAMLAVNYPDMDGLNNDNPSMFPIFMRPRFTYEAYTALKDAHILNDAVFSRTYLAGFSLGGYTAMVNYGLRPHFIKLPTICQEHKETVLLCSPKYRAKIESMPPMLGNYTIPNIKGLILIAPAMGILFDKKEARAADVPVKVFAGGKDSVVTGDYDADYVGSMFEDHSLTTFKNAEHMTFLAPCSAETSQNYPDLCSDNEDVNRADIHNRMNNLIIEFLNSNK